MPYVLIQILIQRLLHPIFPKCLSYQWLKKLLFTVSPTLYVLMFKATGQGKFTHYTY